jgi:hypothetical protein
MRDVDGGLLTGSSVKGGTPFDPNAKNDEALRNMERLAAVLAARRVFEHMDTVETQNGGMLDQQLWQFRSVLPEPLLLPDGYSLGATDTAQDGYSREDNDNDDPQDRCPYSAPQSPLRRLIRTCNVTGSPLAVDLGGEDDRDDTYRQAAEHRGQNPPDQVVGRRGRGRDDIRHG